MVNDDDYRSQNDSQSLLIIYLFTSQPFLLKNVPV